MNNKEMGDVVFALKYCFEFYGKTLDKQQLQVWQNIIRSNSYNSVQWTTVLKGYFQVGKFAPRPPEILEMLAEERQHTQAKAPPPKELTTNCPPHIADAWRYWIPRFWGQPLPGASTEVVDNPEKEDEYLMTVNREAKRTRLPDSIPDEYKLKEVWGDISIQLPRGFESNHSSIPSHIHSAGSNGALPANKVESIPSLDSRTADRNHPLTEERAEPNDGKDGGNIRSSYVQTEMAEATVEVPWSVG